jgi:hypothetical protein
MNIPTPLRLTAMFLAFVAFGTYLAVCDWIDRRKAGADYEGDSK